MRAISPSSPAADDPKPQRLVLRDGTVTAVRAAIPADCGRVARLFHDLSPESHYKRFFSVTDPSKDLIRRFCDTADPAGTATLIATREGDDGERIVAVASYMALTKATADAAFAVADDFQGKGIGTLLLEHLAAKALRHGFMQFHATTMSGNDAMLEVFRESGFEIRSRLESGCADVELSLTLPLAGWPPRSGAVSARPSPRCSRS